LRWASPLLRSLAMQTTHKISGDAAIIELVEWQRRAPATARARSRAEVFARGVSGKGRGPLRAKFERPMSLAANPLIR
jgi:hypothetical protein